MAQIIEHEWRGLLVGQQKDDGYVNATQLSKAYWQATGNRKDPANWATNKRTKDSIAYLSTVTGIPVTELVIVKQGNFTGEEQGTWIHPKLAVNFAVWLSVELEFIVFGWVEEWLKGEPTDSQQKALPPLSRDNQIELLRLLSGSLERSPDERNELELQVIAINLLKGESPASAPQLLSVTEWLATIGYCPPKKKENWLGRKVAEAWRSMHGSDPKTTKKQLKTGHVAEAIKVYPQDFLPTIIEVTEDYCEVELT